MSFLVALKVLSRRRLSCLVVSFFLPLFKFEIALLKKNLFILIETMSEPVILMVLLLPFSNDALDMTLQTPITNDDGPDIIIGGPISGLTIFASLPYLNCFAASDTDAYNIAIKGEPFDTVSTVHRFKFLVRRQRCEQNIAFVYAFKL